MDKRLIELALEALELRKTSIDAEIAAIRAELTGRRKAGATPSTKAVAPTRKRGPRSRAARKAQSERMKAYWERRRAEKAKMAVKAEGDAKKRR